MPKKAATVGDIGTDHDGFPPTPIIEGSQDIIIDNKPAARVDDALAPHAKPGNPPHDRAITTGSKTVFFNYKAAALTGSEVGCGGVIIGGGSVIIGDQVPSGGAAAMAMRSAVAPLASGPVTSPVDIPAEPVAISLEDFEILSGTKHDRKLLTGAIEILNHSSTAIGIVKYIRKEENNQKIKLFMREENGDEVLTRYDAESKTVFWDPTLKTWLGIECTVPDTAECDHHGSYFKKKPSHLKFF